MHVLDVSICGSVLAHPPHGSTSRKKQQNLNLPTHSFKVKIEEAYPL
jgi:hypothetical protein